MTSGMPKSARGWSVHEVLQMWGTTHNTVFAALEDSLGRDRVERLIVGQMRQAGRDAAETHLPDATEIGQAILAIEEPWGIEGRVVEATPNQFTREVSKCPWSYFRPLACQVFAWWMKGFVEGSNGQCQYSLDKMIPEGADACVWRVTRDAP